MILMTVFTTSRGLTTMVPSIVIIYGVLAIFQDTPIDLDINDTWPFVDIVVSTSPCASHQVTDRRHQHGCGSCRPQGTQRSGIHWRTMCDSKVPRQTRDLKVDLRRLESSGGVMVAIGEREQMERINNRVGETKTGIRRMKKCWHQNCTI